MYYTIVVAVVELVAAGFVSTRIQLAFAPSGTCGNCAKVELVNVMLLT